MTDTDRPDICGAEIPERAMVVSSGPPLSLKVLYCVNALGIPADLVDIGPTSMARYSRYRARYSNVKLDAGDPERLAERTNRLVGEWGTTIVIPADIGAMGRIHEIRDRIRSADVFPVSSPAVLDELDDKWRFHCFLEEHGIDHPKSALIDNPDRIEAVIAAGIDPPWMIKPLYAESGHGITIADSPEELSRQLRASRYMGTQGILVQEFVRGVDADISIIARDGRVVAQVVQMRCDGKRIDFAENEAVEQLAERIAEASDYTGVMNIDVRIDPESGRVVVIECNPRFWYTLQAAMWRGINFVGIGMGMAKGEAWMGTTPTDGSYHYHGTIAKRILWRPWEWRSVAGYNWRGFVQAASDPLPFVWTRLPDRLRNGS